MSGPEAVQRRANLRAFAELLRRLRLEAGHPSARDFYRANGGRPRFRCTYEQYLNVESGRCAPTPGLLEKIAVGLQVWLNEDKSRRLFTAYLRLLLGSETLLEMVTQAVRESRSGPGAPPLRQALQRDLETRRCPLTQEQADSMCVDKASYALAKVFCNDGGEWTVEELSALLRLPEAAVRAAVKRYLRNGFLVASRDGRSLRCFAAGKVLVSPRRTPFLPPEEEARRCERFDKELSEERGGVELRESLYLKSQPAALRRYFPYLAQTVTGASVYSTKDRGAGTAFYVVQTVVRRLFTHGDGDNAATPARST